MTIKNVFDTEKKYIKKYEKVAEDIIKKEEEYKKYSDLELQEKTNYFIGEIKAGKTFNDIMVDCFATVKESATRCLKMTPFKVQLIGAQALIDGKISEMKTGEGKTLTSTLAVYMMALNKEGVHVVTVNDYLAKRDAEEMGVLYNFLGLTVGYSARDMTKEEKKEAYNSDITYVTNNELGFDYLRDNMVLYKEDKTLRNLKYVIIDEVDSILIDEARTPLIISGQEKKSLEIYYKTDALVKGFKETDDYVVNITDKVAYLRKSGIEKIERLLVRGNLFDVENSGYLHSVNQALKANYCMYKDIDYVVKDGKIIIVDSFTGRLMEGRAYSDGLHQALEAKENVKTNKETKTLATITFQNFFRLYSHIAGMTGTAKTEEEEFVKTYGLEVICIPTNEKLIRKDSQDTLFITENEKLDYMIDIIKERHTHGQPLLIGTVAIESSMRISSRLRKENIEVSVLNAKEHEKEAEIIANAGQRGSITIATNMAGRGTDIKISQEVKDLKPFISKVTNSEEDPAGLFVIGTERHESRRIDNQLRGRSGRQGDKGETAFFVSFEDDLLKRYKSKTIESLLKRFEGTGALKNKRLTKQIETSQRKVESINFDTRKTVLKYDDVMREQREVIYDQRDFILENTDIIDNTKDIIKDYASRIVDLYLSNKNTDEFNDAIKASFTNEEVSITLEEEAKQKIIDLAEIEFINKIEQLGQEKFNNYLKMVILRVFDEAWINHIDEMQVLRQSIGLRGYGQIDPLHEYQREGRRMFEEMLSRVESEIIKIILKGKVRTNTQRENQVNLMEAQHSKIVGQKNKTVINTTKVGRNEKCPCGSGKKYKDCCGK